VVLTKLGIDKEAYKIQYMKAIEGCWTCPCCGADKEHISPRGLTSKGKNTVSGCFMCQKCSAEWQSEPYFTEEHFRTLGKICTR
jgi:hypothetical protein